MKKVLLIASWYPTPENEIVGSFFREQAVLFENDLDFFVVTLKPLKVGILKYFYYCLKKKYLYFDILTPPKGIGIKYLQVKFPRGSSLFRPFAKFIEKFNIELISKYSYNSLTCKLEQLNWKPDFIHAHSVENGGVFANYVSEKFKIPYIITEHQPFILQNLTQHKIELLFNAISKAKRILAVSEHQKRQILITGVSCFPEVVGNLVDDNLSTINSKKHENFNILAVTYPSYIKDNDTLFKAIRNLVFEKKIKLKLLLIGGDLNKLHLKNEENPLYKEAEKYGILDYVEILNTVERKKMPEFYNKSDVFVSTSIAETFGVAQCEAMMCGIPVIATANGGIDDIITEKNGIKIPIQDFEALAIAILKIKNSEITFDSVEIRNSVINKFGNTAFKNKLFKIYNNINE